MNAVSAQTPMAAVIARRVDFPTWLPAMMVKELRQGLRARGFVGTLVGFQVIMTLFTVFAVAGGTGSSSFSWLQGVFWVVLNVQLLVITPGRALMGLQAELDSRSVDLLMLTRLTAWRIVLGKWISLLVQAALLVVAMLPYGVARYFFGSVDLAGEAKVIALIFAGSAVLTAGALWASALPKLARVGFGLCVVFVWQFLPGSITTLFSLGGGRSTGPSGPAASLMGSSMWIVVFDAALILVLCLSGAVRRLAPPAESQAPLLRTLPLIALLPAPFLGLPAAMPQLFFSALLFAFVAAIELGSDEQPRPGHWNVWVRRGPWGRVIGRLLQPGWASAMEWVLVVAAGVALGGLTSSRPGWVAQIALLTSVALIFPALMLTWMSAQFTQRAAGYVLVLGGASLIAAVGTASATFVQQPNRLWADFILMVLPISSFWSALHQGAPAASMVIWVQIAVAAAVLGIAWWRARTYRVLHLHVKTERGDPQPVVSNP